MRGYKWISAAAVIIAAAAYVAPCVTGAERSGIPPVREGRMAYFQWAPDLDAAGYEIEIFGEKKEGEAAEESRLYSSRRIYTNSALIALSHILRAGRAYERLWWRVRPLNLSQEPIGPFTALQDYVPSAESQRETPIPRAFFNREKGSALLYPVYSFTPMENAARYEVEVTSREPENPGGTAPSRYRVFSRIISNANLYDPEPRAGTYWWRVRAMDGDGAPIGQWSEAQRLRADPADQWQVAIVGDSISHGGGRLSYGPADWTYSYAHYLDFPAVNLSESGDTSRMTAERFQRDVAPFHPEYALIMTGANSLRAGVPAAEVIADLRDIQKQAEEQGIRPILLTLPPINPANIRRAFGQPTADGWEAAFREVNEFIRSQPSIDTASAFSQWEKMPAELAADGLHGDWLAKKIMAAVINRDMPIMAPDLKTY